MADKDLGGGGVAGQGPLDLSKLFDDPRVAAMKVFVSGGWLDFILFASFRFW